MELGRSDSTKSVRIEQATAARPRISRQFSRRDTAREALQNPKVYEQRFETIPFADPKPVKGFLSSKPLFTEEHEHLLRRLRSEAARLSADLTETRNNNSLLKLENVELWSKNVTQKTEMARMQNRLMTVSKALLGAQTQLNEMDRVYAANKRQSRTIDGLAFELASLDKENAGAEASSAGQS